MRRLLPLALPLLVAATFFACEESTVSTGQPFYDYEAGGYDANRPSSETGAPDGAVPSDAPSDAEPAAERLALVAVGTGTMPITSASIFADGKWAALSPIGPDEYGAVGGGVTFLPSGRALAVLRGNESGNDESTTWNGTNWGILGPFSPTAASFVSPPARTATGAFVADQAGQGALAVRLYTYTDATSGWGTTPDPVGITGNNRTIPAVAPTANGDPLVIMGASGGGYQWSVRTAAKWSTPAALAGITPPDGDSGNAAVVAVKRIGSPQIVAVFSHQPNVAPAIVAAVYDGTAWSAPVTLGTDLMGSAVFAPFALATRPDGAVGVAYARANGGIRVGAFDGTKWSAMVDVPNVTVAQAYGPIAMAAGASTLDLAFVDTNLHLAYARFANNAWTMPAVLDDKSTYSKVSLAHTP